MVLQTGADGCPGDDILARAHRKTSYGLDLGWDKFNHVAAFSVLAGLAWFSNVAPSKTRYLGYVLVLTYGILLECLQTLTPNRVFEWSDIAADVAGIIIYAIALHHLAIRLPVLRSLVRIEAV